MAVADLVSAWLLPFIAPIILYFAKYYAIRKGWWPRPPLTSHDSDRELLDVLKNVLANNVRHSDASDTNLNAIKENLQILIQLGEAHQRDGGM